MRRAAPLCGSMLAWLVAVVMMSRAGAVAVPSTRGAPELARARVQHASVVLDDGSVLVIGGTDGPHVWSDAERLDPNARRWRAAGTTSEPRHAPAATLLADGRVLVAGGHVGRTALASADVYDPIANRWEPTAPMHASRSFPAMARLADGRVMVLGTTGDMAERASAELWDPRTGRWTPAAAPLERRDGATITALRDGRVLAVGGMFVASGAAEVYDGTHDRWSLVAPLASLPMPSRQGTVDARPIDGHTATLLSDGRVLITGGRYQPTDLSLSAAQVFDPTTNTFRATGPMSAARVHHGASVRPDGRVLVSGGLRWGFRSRAEERRAWAEACEGVFLPTNAIRTAELWDPSTDRWSAARSLRVGRWLAGSVALPDGRVMVAGGTTAARVLRSVEVIAR